MTAIYSPRVRVSGLVDDYSGSTLDSAVLTGETVRLGFRHLATGVQKTVNISAASPFTEILQTRVIELVDSNSSCRLLKVSPEGREALQSVVKRLNEQEFDKRISKAPAPNVKLYSVGRTNAKLGAMILLECSPLPDIELRFDPTIYLEHVEVNTDRLELRVRVNDKQLLAALDNPDEQALESLSWGAASGRLRWFGLIGELVRLEPLRVVVLDQEQLQQALRSGGKTAVNGVLDG